MYCNTSLLPDVMSQLLKGADWNNGELKVIRYEFIYLFNYGLLLTTICRVACNVHFIVLNFID